MNLVNVCAVQVCRAGERDGMLTRQSEREGAEGKRRNLKAKWREGTECLRAKLWVGGGGATAAAAHNKQ